MVALGWITGACDKHSEPATGGVDASQPRLGDVMKTPALIASVERLATRACACETTECRSEAQAELDRVVQRHRDVILAPKDNQRVRTAAQALVDCAAPIPEPSAENVHNGASSDREDGGELSGPSDSDEALAALMRAVKQRCRCEPSDLGCVGASTKALNAAVAASEQVTFGTAQEATRRSLVFQGEDCAAAVPSKGLVGSHTKGTGGAVTVKEPVAAGVRGGGVPAGPPSRGKLKTWRQLPRSVNGIKHLLRVGAAQDSEAIRDIWSKTAADVLQQFPKAYTQEVDDLEPDVVRLRLPLAEVDNRGRALMMEWAFMGKRLFMVTVELKRSAQQLVEQVETFMGRKPDSETEERWKMRVATWREEGLLLRATVDGKSNDFAIADPIGHAAYTAQRAKVRPAYLANRRGLVWLLGRPLLPNSSKAEGALLKALEVAPEYGHANVNLCRLYMLRGQTKAASGRCRKARDSRNTSAHAESALYTGKLALLANNPANAKKWFRLVTTYDPEDSGLVPAASRHLRVMSGKGSKRDLGRVMRRIHCAQVEGDGTRADVYARSYGFVSVAAATKAAQAKGVDLVVSEAKAAKRCKREKP